MDALLMCGGCGTRLRTAGEKPLFEIGGRPMIDRVAAALEESRCDDVYAVGSPATPRTRAHWGGEYIETPGAGYVEDLQSALEGVAPPVLTVAADLPLLDADVLDGVLDAHAGGSLRVCVPAALKRRLGVSVGTTLEDGGRELAPTGCNVVDADGDEETLVRRDVELAVNVNRIGDATVAEQYL